MGKNRVFLCWPSCIGHWTGQLGTAGQLRTVDSGQWTVDSGQWTVDSGQWTDGLSSTGQWDTGRAILYWTEAARDSWTVDAGQVDSGRDRVDRSTVLTLEY